jgi:hypothetical protein
MSERTEEVEVLPVGEAYLRPGVVVTALAGGVASTVLMLPVLVGLPALLGLFRTEPVTEFAGFAAFVGIEPTLGIGLMLFAAGGIIVIPLVFLVVGAFLPPKEPEYLRGVTIAMFFWTGFLSFWPNSDLFTVASFLVFSILAHVVYGLTLGLVLDRTIGIPEHEV